MGTIELVVGNKTYDNIIQGFLDLGASIDTGFLNVSRAVNPILLRSLNDVSSELARRHSNPWNKRLVNETNNLQSRSGGGLRSIKESVKSRIATGDLFVVGQISAGSLSFHEQGGTIRATRAQFLTIPLPAALDPRGVPLRQRARQWDNTFVRRSRKGNLIIFRSLPGRNDLVPLYLLKKSVYIKPRLGMELAFDKHMGYFEVRAFEEISDVLDKFIGK